VNLVRRPGARSRLGATLYLYATERLVLEIVPFELVLVAMFAAATIRSLTERPGGRSRTRSAKRRDAC
jgi:hypothetical protein